MTAKIIKFTDYLDREKVKENNLRLEVKDKNKSARKFSKVFITTHSVQFKEELELISPNLVLDLRLLPTVDQCLSVYLNNNKIKYISIVTAADYRSLRDRYSRCLEARRVINKECIEGSVVLCVALSDGECDFLNDYI